MSDVDRERNGVEEELRQVVLERMTAVYAKDSEPPVARQAPDVVTFDVLPPLHYHSSETAEEKTQA